MSILRRENVQPRVLKGGYNMYTSTVSLGGPFQPDTNNLQQDEFFGKVARHWSETVDNGLEGTKRAEF